MLGSTVSSHSNFGKPVLMSPSANGRAQTSSGCCSEGRGCRWSSHEVGWSGPAPGNTNSSLPGAQRHCGRGAARCWLVPRTLCSWGMLPTDRSVGCAGRRRFASDCVADLGLVASVAALAGRGGGCAPRYGPEDCGRDRSRLGGARTIAVPLGSNGCNSAASDSG